MYTYLVDGECFTFDKFLLLFKNNLMSRTNIKKYIILLHFIHPSCNVFIFMEATSMVNCDYPPLLVCLFFTCEASASYQNT